MQTQDNQKKNVQKEEPVNVLGENDSVAMLEEINKEFGDTINFLDEKIVAMKEKIENTKTEVKKQTKIEKKK